MVETGQQLDLAHDERLAQVNGVLTEHNLARPLTHVGDVSRGEVAILEAGEVINCGQGLYMVEMPARFRPDTIDEKTGQLKESKGKFWPFFRSEESHAQNQLFVPFVKDAPDNFDFPIDTPRTDERIDRINAQLIELNLKPLPFPVNEPTKEILDIANIIDVNKGFFSVVVFKVKGLDGSITEEPYVMNARSGEGVDGAVFAPTVHLPVYGHEARFLMGDTYRPTLGSWVLEVSRGFFNPSDEKSLKVAGIEKLINSDIPGFKRAIEELGQETGLVSPENLSYGGRLRQDPSFEVSEPFLYGIDVDAPLFEKRDLDAAEKIQLKFESYGEFFSKIEQISDAFTLSAIARNLLKQGKLGVSQKGRDAQEQHERMVFTRPYRVQHGERTTEVLRASLEDGFPVDYEVGEVAVNTGIARIIPDVHVGEGRWEDIRKAADRTRNALRLLYPYDVLAQIENGNMDIVTTAAAVKAMHGKGYLRLT